VRLLWRLIECQHRVTTWPRRLRLVLQPSAAPAEGYVRCVSCGAALPFDLERWVRV
jgi:hypothetical protein